MTHHLSDTNTEGLESVLSEWYIWPSHIWLHEKWWFHPGNPNYNLVGSFQSPHRVYPIVALKPNTNVFGFNECVHIYGPVYGIWSLSACSGILATWVYALVSWISTWSWDQREMVLYYQSDTCWSEREKEMSPAWCLAWFWWGSAHSRYSFLLPQAHVSMSVAHVTIMG